MNILKDRKANLLTTRVYLIFIYLLILTFPSLLFAKDYYVSPSGSDLNPGTLSSPFQTISHGIYVMSGGDDLFVRNGTYFEKIVIYKKGGSENNPTVVLAYPGENPVIDGKESLPGTDYSAMVMIWDNYVHFSGFEVKNSNVLGVKAGGDGINVAGNNCLVSNCTVHDCWNSGIYIGNFGIVEYCTVYNCCLSNEIDPGSTFNGSGISSAGNAPTSYNDHATIRHNTVHDNWGEGISTFEANNSTIEHNIIYDNWSANLYVSDAIHCLVQCNLIYKTKDLPSGSQIGIFLGDETFTPSSSHNTIINNIVYGCRRNCYVSMKQDNTLIANNTFMNSTYINCVQINNTNHVNSSFVNNLVIQEGSLEAISNYTSCPGMTMNHNHWSKTPDSDAYSSSDIIDVPNISKKGSVGAGELTGNYFTLLETSRAINKGQFLNIITRDYFGNLRDDSTDIGAHEFLVSVDSIIVTGEHGANTINTDKGTLQLTTEIIPAKASNKRIRWSIVNGTGKATIDSSGLILAIADGTVTVTATATDGSGVSGNLIITISNQVILIESIHVHPLNFVTPVLKEKNDSLQMEADILPEEVKNSPIKWSVESISGQATINDKGLMKSISNGTVKVIATAMDGSNVTGFCMVDIINQSEVTDTNDFGYQSVQMLHKLLIIPNNKNTQINFYSIFNIIGALIHKEKVSFDPVEIDLSIYPTGVYILYFSGNHSLAPLKIIIP
jgi:parallel beta-helix repeat protein